MVVDVEMAGLGWLAGGGEARAWLRLLSRPGLFGGAECVADWAGLRFGVELS